MTGSSSILSYQSYIVVQHLTLRKKLANQGVHYELKPCDPNLVVFNYSSIHTSHKLKTLLSFGLNFGLPLYKTNFFKYYYSIEKLGKHLKDKHCLDFRAFIDELSYVSWKLVNNKSCGLDGIPFQGFKYAPIVMHTWLAKFINMMLVQSYLPCAVVDVNIKPILKSSTHNQTESGNHRQFAVSASAPKLMEKVL